LTPESARQPHARCRGRWRGEIQLDTYGPTGRKAVRKASGKTKTAVADRLQSIRDEITQGIGKPGSANYTVRQACKDWLTAEPPGNTAKTVLTNREALEHVLLSIGRTALRELTATDVNRALRVMAKSQSTAYVAKAHSALNRAVRHAAARDIVARNVVSFTKPPGGQVRRKTRSMTLAQLQAALGAARKTDLRMYVYVALCATTAVRTEEARALQWENVHLDVKPPHVEVWRSVRASGDTKTEKSRRTLALAELGRTALADLKPDNATGYVFCTSSGRPMDAANIRRDFRAVCKLAKIGTDWTPRELRHTGISLMSLGGLKNEEIARIAGHSTTRTLELVYRDELRPVITTGAAALDVLLGDAG
jgi:integrase